MPGVKKPGTPKMFDLLEMTYNSKDIGFYEKKGLKLRANSKQIACWEMAIDLLAVIPTVEQRRLIWTRSCRFGWSEIARRFGCHRVTAKKRYKDIIIDLESVLPKSMLDKIDNLI